MKWLVMILLILILVSACSSYRGNCCPILGSNDVVENPRYVKDFIKNAKMYKIAFEKCACNK